MDFNSDVNIPFIETDYENVVSSHLTEIDLNQHTFVTPFETAKRFFSFEKFGSDKIICFMCRPYAAPHTNLSFN